MLEELHGELPDETAASGSRELVKLGSRAAWLVAARVPGGNKAVSFLSGDTNSRLRLRLQFR